MNDLESTILQALVRVSDALTNESSEDSLQVALAAELSPSERELRVSFAPPTRSPQRPPQLAIDQLAARNPPRSLPAEGRDPCASAARLDLLWHSSAGLVPIELKFCAQWKADTNGYQFLKDVHRLERMVTAGSHRVLSDTRFAAFVTNQDVYWRGARPEPQPFWLSESRVLAAGHWVQYDQKSPDTLWFSYPPFFLSNPYSFRWRDLRGGWKCLLVEVRPQVPHMSIDVPLPNER